MSSKAPARRSSRPAPRWGMTSMPSPTHAPGSPSRISTRRSASVARTAASVSAIAASASAAASAGVQGVPFYVIAGKYALSGAQPAETTRAALAWVREQESRTPSV